MKKDAPVQGIVRMGSNTSVASVSKVVDYLKNGQKLGAEGFNAVLKSVGEGWDYKKKVAVAEADKTYMTTLLASALGTNKDRLTRLMQSWDILKKQAENDPSVFPPFLTDKRLTIHLIVKRL